MNYCQECGRKTCGDDCLEYQDYRDLLDEGYTHAQAAVMSGWKGAEEI